MIRWTIIYLVLIGVIAVGMRDWFKALCALIVISVLHEHQYFRDPFAGIPGLRLINVMLPIIIWQWTMQRSHQGLRWDAPHSLRVGVVAYVLVLLYGVALALPDFDLLMHQGWTISSFGYNEVVFPLIPVIMAVMLYDGARSRERIVMAMLALVVMAVIAGAYIIKLIPASSLLDAGSVLRYRMRIDRQFGLHPNDVVSILVPGIWIAVGCILLIRRNLYRALLAGGVVIMGIGLLLTQSRTGMVGLAGVTLMIGMMRFRAAAVVMVLLGVGVYFALPSISANWSRGVDVHTIQGETTADLNEITNGRVELWKLALEDIGKAPLVGHGRQYWSRVWVGHEHVLGSHPHNAYLEVWIAYGVFGLLIVVALFISMLVPSVRMMRKGLSRLELAVGIGATACIITHLVVGMGGRAFLPRVSAIITFCMCALSMRMYVSGRTLVGTAPAGRRLVYRRVVRPAPVLDGVTARSRADTV